MIRKLRIRFIALSMLALFILLLVIVTGMNVINYNAVIMEADNILEVLSRNRGAFPDLEGEDRKSLPSHMSPETPYESRYFSVLVDTDGEVIETDTRRIKAVSAQQAQEYAFQVLSRHENRGFVDQYRFAYDSERERTRVIFLDCRRSIEALHAFQFASVGMALAGYAGFFFAILFFSGRIIRPVAESYEKQKRFITDAGHEIKTPLAIIKADADVLEMEYADNEWIRDIQKQTNRLAALTNDLVYLARMEEAENQMQMISFSLSDVVYETASSFQALAQIQKKTFESSIQPLLSIKGDEKAVSQLVSILLDNAFKYSPPDGMIRLTLRRQGREIQLIVWNTTASTVSREDLSMLFDRFYRMDASRNFETGGYGIGLSVAKAIVTAHHGRIQAKTEDGNSLQMIVSFPA